MAFKSMVRGVGERCVAYGLPRTFARQFECEVLKWEENCGPAWAVQHLKEIKSDVIRNRAGQPLIAWIRKNSRGQWYGVLGSLLRYAAQSDRCFQTVINCLMVYSAYIPAEPTAQHYEQVKANLGSPPGFIPPRLLESVREHVRELGLSAGRNHWDHIPPLIAYAGSPSRRSPIWGGASVPQDQDLEKELEWFQLRSHLGFARMKYWPVYGQVLTGVNRSEFECLSPINGHWFFPYQNRPPLSVEEQNCPPEVGNLVPLTKDGGWKVRWIANPYRIHQLALEPLGSQLFKLLRSLPWDCTFDQQKAIPYIQNHLRQGKTAFAVDLSAATDHFPLDLQLEVLAALSTCPTWAMLVDLFRDLSRGCWWNPNLGYIRWRKGQPMGLYPSFPAFALTHGVLLSSLSVLPGQFYVLGDDVVILDPGLYDRYVRTLDLLDCPHNSAKSLVSSRVTEFAGQIITPHEVIPQYKWRGIGDDSFLDAMRAFGPRFEALLKQRQKAVYQAVSRLLPPWGCNHSNGAAWPLERVVATTDEFEALTCEVERGRKYDASFLQRILQLLNPENPNSLYHSLRSYEVRRQANTFDEKVSRAFMGTVFQEFKGNRTPLTDVLEVTGFPGLPGSLQLGVKERRTLLEILEGYVAKWQATKAL